MLRAHPQGHTGFRVIQTLTHQSSPLRLFTRHTNCTQWTYLSVEPTCTIETPD